MASRHDKKNGGLAVRVEKLELALFGTDGRGGMVADISEIKTKLQIMTSILRTVVIPIVLPIVLALFGFWLGAKWHY